MLISARLRELQQADMASVDIDELVDIRTVDVDSSDPVEVRVQKYLDQMKNPYLFRVSSTKVKLIFDTGDRTLEDAMRGYLKSIMR